MADILEFQTRYKDKLSSDEIEFLSYVKDRILEVSECLKDIASDQRIAACFHDAGAWDLLSKFESEIWEAKIAFSEAKSWSLLDKIK